MIKLDRVLNYLHLTSTFLSNARLKFDAKKRYQKVNDWVRNIKNLFWRKTRKIFHVTITTSVWLYYYSIQIRIMHRIIMIHPVSKAPRNWGPVHTYPDIFESATFSFRIRLSSKRIRRIRKQIRKFLNPLSRVEIFESDNILDTCGRSNRDIFWYYDVTKLAPVFTSQI